MEIAQAVHPPLFQASWLGSSLAHPIRLPVSLALQEQI